MKTRMDKRTTREALRMEELRMVSGGRTINTGKMEEAAKALFPESRGTQSFVWLKPTPNH